VCSLLQISTSTLCKYDDIQESIFLPKKLAIVNRQTRKGIDTQQQDGIVPRPEAKKKKFQSSLASTALIGH